MPENPEPQIRLVMLITSNYGVTIGPLILDTIAEHMKTRSTQFETS